MKLWLPSIFMPSNTNPYGPVLSNTLYIGYFNSLLFCGTHLPRRKLRMGNTKFARKRSLILFHLFVYAHCPRTILRVLRIQRNMKCWSCAIFTSNNDSLRRICSSVGTNVLLRRNGYYKSTICCTIYGGCPGTMDLRWVLGR